ncbi:MAG TPA: DUF6088 family protein [Chitinophagaceae bacterium]|nr:DUF6088 family protein [Chitinophagaceae bacterium]
MVKTQTYIRDLLSGKKPGDLVFAADFKGKGTEAAIRKSLSRLAAEGRIKRAAHGIYYLPKIDPLFGELQPSAEEIAQKIADKERVRIQPTGAYALNKLGLSTQVPMKMVYLTDGVQRLLTIGKVKVKFKATTNKKLSMKGELSKLIILALEELDLKKIDTRREAKIRELLLKEDPEKLNHDLALAPGRIHDYIVKLLKTPSNDRVA